MLREEVEQYTNLTGEDGWHVPIMKVGAYLDGYNKGLEVLDKIRADIEELDVFYDNDYFSGNKDAMLKRNEILQIINKYKKESEVE